MVPQDQEVLREVIERTGFTRESDTLYVRYVADELRQCVRLSFSTKRRTCLEVFLELQHEKIRDAATSLLKQAYPKNANVIGLSLLDVIPLYEAALSIAERTADTAFYDYLSNDEFARMLPRLEKDLAVAVPRYFGRLSSLSEVVTYFRDTPGAGGAAHDILFLMITYYFGDFIAASRLADEYCSSRFSEITRKCAEVFRLEYLR